MVSLLDMLDGNQDQAPHSAFGDSFGGAGNSMIAPYLGQQGLDAARNNTLMSIGAAMLQAGAPSTDPSHGSFGAALGAGALGGINAYQNSVNRGMQSVNAAQQMQMGKLNLAKQLMLMKLASGLAGGGDTSSQQTGLPQQSDTQSNVQMPSSSPPRVTGNSETNTPLPTAGGGSAQSDLNPLGMPNNLAAMYMLSNPNGYLQQQGSAFAPTDLIKNMRASGINPSSNTGKVYLDNFLQKQGYIAPLAVRQGTSVYDPVNRKWIGFNPMTAQGTAPVRDENGNVVGIQALPGAADTTQQMEAAKSIGHAAGQLVDVTGPDGATYKVPASTLLKNQQNIDSNQGLNPPLPNGVQSNQGTAPLPGMQNGLSNQATLSPAALAAQTQTGKTSADQLSQDRELAGNYATRMFQLQQAYNGLQNADTGAGSNYVNRARSFLMAQGPEFLQNMGIVNADKVASYDEANKYLTQYAMAQAGALGNGTDQKLATILSGNASTHISNLAAQDVVRANMALEAMRQAATLQAGRAGIPPDKYSQWRAEFERNVDPRVFAWNMLTPQKQMAAYKSMSPTQQAQFRDQYSWANRSGLLPQQQ